MRFLTRPFQEPPESPQYAMRREEGVNVICRKHNGNYIPLQEGDFSQGLLDYVVGEIQAGRLSQTESYGFHIPNPGERVDNFEETFGALAEHHYESIQRGLLELSVDIRGTVKARGRYSRAEIRPWD